MSLGWQELLPGCTLNSSALSLQWGRCSGNLFFFFLLTLPVKTSAPLPIKSSTNHSQCAEPGTSSLSSEALMCFSAAAFPSLSEQEILVQISHPEEALIKSVFWDQLLIHDRKVFIIKVTRRETRAARAQREYVGPATCLSGGTEMWQTTFSICSPIPFKY